MGTVADISDAIAALRRGEVVVLPTETVYGLAANALDTAAVENIFRVKSRPLQDPLIVHVLDGAWIGRYADISSCSEHVPKIVDAFWPGPVTIVLKKKEIIPDIVTAGFDTVAIRCPRHEIFRNVLEQVDFPLAAPSANPFGYVSPTGADQVVRTLGDRIKIILDGGRCSVGLESTILDLSRDRPKILRPGPVTAEEISEIIGENVIDYAAHGLSENPNVPGQLKQHYCTETKLVLFDGKDGKFDQNFSGEVAVIFAKKPDSVAVISQKMRIPERNIFWLSEVGDMRTVAKNLFATLQKLDAVGYDAIMCELPPRSGIGVAIHDRLTRAAAKFS
ncbi:MAG: threonylcarbamoyl-AMP synthase [Puniceicoccales bacterium]|jgi:L-threonylcarbamoyladenylate synthase|nr:threonylcarbamoyl-AMP synthase [Puniceicoccales bacterium]